MAIPRSFMSIIQKEALYPWIQALCTEKCRFMGKEVREISHFFVEPPREFPLSVCALTHLLIAHKYSHLSTVNSERIIQT